MGRTDIYVYSSVQEECSAAVIVQVQYIYSHKLPSRKTAPVERPHDTTAICLLLSKEHSHVSVLVLVRGAAVDFRPLPVLCRVVIASPGSFTSSGVYNSLGQNLFLLESYSILGSEVFSHLWPLGTLMAPTRLVGFACPRQIDAGGRRCILLQIVITPHFFFGENGFIAHHLVRSLFKLWFKCRTNINRTLSWRSICALVG